MYRCYFIRICIYVYECTNLSLYMHVFICFYVYTLTYSYINMYIPQFDGPYDASPWLARISGVCMSHNTVHNLDWVYLGMQVSAVYE
jgi:hypothetical protein